MVATTLAAAVPLLGVSLGVSAAPTPDGAGPAPGAKNIAAGQRLAQRKFVEPPLAPNTLQSRQLKLKPVESRQLKLKPRSKTRKPRRTE
jgi:hypothetical protein